MKKDPLIVGVLLAFVAFALMIVIFGYEAVRSKKPSVAETARKARSETARRDFSAFKTIETQDGARMVLVPEGTFSMGSPPVEGDPDEIPQRTIDLSAYYIDLYEVTHRQFARFVSATRAAPPVVPVFSDDVSKIMGQDQPVVGVSWEQARDYCRWLDKRLPTEAEWEKAARGERAFKWPGGNVFSEGEANIEGAEDGFRYTAPPGRFEAGRSPYGLYDMAGNVAEWVADWYDEKYYLSGTFRDPQGPETGTHRVYRGGSWNDSPTNVRTAKRFAAAVHQTSAVIGFRCAKDG